MKSFATAEFDSDARVDLCVEELPSPFRLQS